MLILTGPTAAGKNTVGQLIARRRPRCAVVDVDLIRAMLVQPHRAPWQGAEGAAQHMLGAQLAAQIATSLVAAGWEVIVLDVVTDAIAAQLRTQLAPLRPTIVQLLPTFAEVRRRFDARGPMLTDDELALVYAQQLRYTDFDSRIDTTEIPAAETAEQILRIWPAPPTHRP